VGLARHFECVEATDASAQQIANAVAAPGVTYSVQAAEATRFPAASFDAVCVAQALHWFDIDRFNAEVKRVLRPGGLLLVTGYGWSHFAPAFEREFERVVLEPLKPHWARENRLLWNRYRDLPFPFTPVAFPDLSIEVHWTFAQVLEYVGTWSATRRLLESEPGFLECVRAELDPAWGPEGPQLVTMPLHVQCGRHEGVRGGCTSVQPSFRSVS